MDKKTFCYHVKNLQFDGAAVFFDEYGGWYVERRDYDDGVEFQGEGNLPEEMMGKVMKWLKAIKKEINATRSI